MSRRRNWDKVRVESRMGHAPGKYEIRRRKLARLLEWRKHHAYAKKWKIPKSLR